jgi:pSer/pThr/pTyr-binding forkhead associated (FHA) protein
MAWLVDEQTGRQYQLFRGDTRIGRKAEVNDIVLNDPTVSREHALIRETNGVFTIYDRGSKGGTFVNAQKIRQPVILYHGDVIELGETRLTFMSSQH